MLLPAPSLPLLSRMLEDWELSAVSATRTYLSAQTVASSQNQSGLGGCARRS